MENQRDHSKFLIQRYDNFISASNIKGNFLLAFNTFLCGILVANYKELLKLVENEKHDYFNAFVLTLFIFALIGTGYILAAVYPFFSSGKSSREKYHSLIFFKTVSEFDNDESFSNQFQGQSENDLNQDMSKQIYWLAKGLTAKYNRLAIAMGFVYLELLLLLCIITLISIY